MDRVGVSTWQYYCVIMLYCVPRDLLANLSWLPGLLAGCMSCPACSPALHSPPATAQLCLPRYFTFSAPHNSQCLEERDKINQWVESVVLLCCCYLHKDLVMLAFMIFLLSLSLSTGSDKQDTEILAFYLFLFVFLSNHCQFSPSHCMKGKK